MKALKIGTDFSGIGAPEMALTMMGVEHRNVMACDIDIHARKMFVHNHGKPDYMFKDITKRDHAEIPQLDLYVAGFPCQAFSMAGHRLGFDDIRGTLFFDTAEFIKINRPRCFVLENVKGLITHDKGRTFQTIIDVLSGTATVNHQMSIPLYPDGLNYHLFYLVMNTKDHGIPQNRERIFIVGFQNHVDFRFPKPIPLEKRLFDLLETDVDEKYFLSKSAIKSVLLSDRHSKSLVNPDIAATLQSPGNACGVYKGMNAVMVKTANETGYEIAQPGDSINTSYPDSKTRRGRVGKQIAQAVQTINYQSVLLGDMKIRRLTPRECLRLQGFPDSFEIVVSDTQAYKQAGNSITVDVLISLFRNILPHIS